MAGKREKPEEIVSKLRQVEVLQGQGATNAEAVRQIGVTQQTFYRWRNPEGQFRLFRIGDAVASRNIHVAVYDAVSLLKDL